MNKNELLLLAAEYFSGFAIELADEPEHSKILSEMGQDITNEYFSFAQMLLRLHGGHRLKVNSQNVISSN